MKKAILYLFILVSTPCFSQNSVESAISSLNTTQNDTVRLRLLLFLAENHPIDSVWKNYNSKAVQLGTNLIKHESFQIKLATAPFLATALNNEGYINLDKNEFFSARQNFKKAAEICIDYNKRKTLPEIYSNLGACMQKFGRLDRAADYYQMAIKEEELFPNTEVKGAILNNLANIHVALNNNEKALQYFEKFIEHTKALNDQNGLLSAYLNTSIFYGNNRKAEKAMFYAKEAEKLALLLKDEGALYEAITEIGEAYRINNEFDSAYSYFNKSVSLALKENAPEKLATPYYNLGLYWLNKKDTKNAEAYYLRSYSIFDSIHDVFGTKNTAELLVVLYDTLHQTEKSNKFLKISLNAKEIILNRENSNAIVKLELQTAFDLKEAEHKLTQEKNEMELKLQKKIRDVFMAGSFLLLLLIILIYFNLRNIKRSKHQLTLKNKEIEKQKMLVIEKQNEMISSIHYAQRIQNAILTGDEVWKRIAKEFFIFYQPKDIISGDFYWAHLMPNGRAIFAVADCTGHGVPGGLMSMLGNSFLNEIVVENKIFNAAVILNKLRDKIKNALEQKGDAIHQDGMDISLCVWNKMDNTLEFAGANNSLFHMRDQRITEFKGSKMPIGTHMNDTTPFVSQTISLQKGDSIYMTSDGLSDQFGGPKAKKYKLSQFTAVLEAMSDLTLEEQGLLLKKDIENWKGELEQTDDICVIGLKV